MSKDYSVTVNMPRDSWQCLVAMSAEDLRKPDEFMHWLLYREAKQRGLLSADAPLPSHSPAHTQHPQAAQS